MTAVVNRAKPNLIEMSKCNLEFPDEFGEDFHPFLFDDFLYHVLWTSTGDRKLLSVNIKTGQQTLIEFHAQFRSVKSIIRKFRPLPTSFRTNKPGFVIVENFGDKGTTCTLHKVEVDIERKMCNILDVVHEFPKTNFCELDFIRNDHTLLLHYESKKHGGSCYTIYETKVDSSKRYSLKPLISFPFDGKWIFGAHVFGDFLIADRSGYRIYVRNLSRQKSINFDYPKPKFFSHFMGALVTSTGLRMYFMDHIKQPLFSEVGVIEVDGSLAITEYKNTFTLDSGWWKPYGIVDDTMFVGNSTDTGYIYFKLPIKERGQKSAGSLRP